MELDGRVAIVTGGAAGIGRAVAHALAAEGATVVVADADRGAANNTVSEITASGGAARAFKADLGLDDDVDKLFAYAVGELNGLDVLVNNAGGVGRSWQRTMDVNLRGLMLASQRAFDEMRGDGAIVNISSVAGLGSRPHGSPAYAAAKAAVVRLTTALPQHDGVRVNCVCPDWVDTPAVQRDLASMTVDERAAVPPLVPAEEIAQIVLDLIRDDSLSGQVVARFADEPGARFLAHGTRD
jgi:NAD(P)-dependent dehydrogenase (short-subunit alcohol dehydrogenase family)